MAAIEYVDTTIGTGNDDGTTWANAWRNAITALGSALASCDAGGTIYIQSDSVHQYAADTTLASANGVAGNPVTIISVTNTNEPPEAGDYETMMDGGGNLDAKTNGAYDIILTGWDIWNGLHFITGDDLAISDNDIDVRLINCKLSIDDNCAIGSLANADAAVIWENVDLEQVTVGNITPNTSFYWKKGSYIWNGGGVPTNWIVLGPIRGSIVRIEDIDVQHLDAGDYLVNDVNTGWDVLIKRCKIPAAVNYMNAGPTGAANQIRFHSVDDGNNIYTFKEYYFEGLIESDTGVYLDATYDGTNGYSAKMTADKGNTTEWSRPLRFKLAEIYITATGKTLTVELLTDNVTLQNDEFWLEVEYPDSTIAALGNILKTKPANILTAPANLTASAKGAGDWTGESGTPVYQKVVADFTGVADEAIGVYTVWACLAKEATVYVDPKIVVA